MRSLSAVAIVALLALLVCREAEGGAAFWRKYGANKIMKKCLTPVGERAWVDQLEKALAFCNEQEASGALPTVAIPSTIDWNRVTNSAVRFTAAKIESIKQKLNKQVQVFRCVTQKVQLTDSTYEVNPEMLLAQYRALNLSASLYGDIEQAVYQCNNFTQCMPVAAGSDMAIPADVIRTKTFMECEMNLRYVGCLKEDLKPILGMFDLSGLDGTLDFLDSDEARAAVVLLANDKVGYPDYGLFE